MFELKAWIRDGVHQLDALFKHALWQVSVTAGHGAAGVAEDVTELFIEMASTAESVGGTVPEAVERQAAPILQIDAYDTGFVRS
jgi:hypothetical protein